jgi:pyruvate ferredoxin oxidoreductase gamma subunit
MQEIRFHGRGGQGAVTAAELIAQAAFFEGKHAQAFGAFGPERRGAPMMSFCRIDDAAITIHQQVYEPDVVVVLDPTLVSDEVFKGLKNDGKAILNAKGKAEHAGASIFSVDATSIALKHLGKPIVNTAMLGAFAKATQLVSLASLERAIRERFKGELAEKNIAAIRECYESLK